MNRHALTPNGWVHEQESSKVVLRPGPQLLVREIGVNTYTSSDTFNIQLAEKYWNETKAFWAEVRAEWSRLHDELGMFGVKTRSQAGKLYNQILILANDARDGKLHMEVAATRARDIIRGSTTTNVAELDPGVGVQDQQSAR